MLSKFFIEHPIMANVIAIVTMILGVVAVMGLPVAQYPDITPPTVQVTATYPGASARVVADTVALPIEQQVNGVENMLYMSSQATADGTMQLTITFKVGTDVDQAMLALSTYLGHARISDTYWYLTGIPELMALTAGRFERFVGIGVAALGQTRSDAPLERQRLADVNSVAAAEAECAPVAGRQRRPWPA